MIEDKHEFLLSNTVDPHGCPGGLYGYLFIVDNGKRINVESGDTFKCACEKFDDKHGTNVASYK